MNILKRVFVHNLTTKLMALLMAGALWTYAYFFSLQQSEYDVPLRINAPAGWAIIDQNPAKLRVRIEYPKYSAEEIRTAVDRNEIVAEYAVGAAPVNPMQPFADISIAHGNIRLPTGAGALVKAVDPDKISFTLAKEESRALPVKLQFSEPPAGYAFAKEPWYNPRTVLVRGPAEALSRADYVNTDEIKVDKPPAGVSEQSASTGIRPYVEVDMDGKRARFTIACSEQIKYILYLSEVSRVQKFDKVKILLVEPPGYPHQVKLKQTEMSVTVRGPKKEVDDLKPQDILLLVNVGELEPGPTPYPQPVTCEIQGVSNPSQLKVELDQQTVGVDVGPT